LGEFYADAGDLLKAASTHSNPEVTAVSKAQFTALLVYKEYEAALKEYEAALKQKNDELERAVNKYKLELSAMSQR
jgi:hypothetical protein